MNLGDPRPLLDRHAARILTRWREQLRALPPSSALAAPELLAPLMAPALARVRHESVLNSSTAADTESDCRCGLNPMVTFYLTGECAAFDVLWAQPDALAPLAPELREQLCRKLRKAWYRVATEEIALFCSLCQRGAAMGAAHVHATTAILAARHTHAHEVLNVTVKGASEAVHGKSSETDPRSGEKLD
ncbi:MAG: hypothetical protein NTU80_12090 [Verrucomicrobia bacterium]|nr:hypothetical protein [Verrucomicrobiota bacterium]